MRARRRAIFLAILPVQAAMLACVPSGAVVITSRSTDRRLRRAVRSVKQLAEEINANG
jgi:hypothetical protein